MKIKEKFRLSNAKVKKLFSDIEREILIHSMTKPIDIKLVENTSYIEVYFDKNLTEEEMNRVRADWETCSGGHCDAYGISFDRFSRSSGYELLSSARELSIKEEVENMIAFMLVKSGAYKDTVKTMSVDEREQYGW